MLGVITETIMSIEIKSPNFPEGISGTLMRVYVAAGEYAHEGEHLFDIETETVILEVESPSDGKLIEYKVGIGDLVESNQVIGVFENCEVPSAVKPLKSTYDPKASSLEPAAGITGAAGLLFKVAGISFILGALVGAIGVYVSLQN